MSGKTSTASKDKYNAKTYDDLKLRVKKGQSEVIKAHAKAQGKSLNGYINDLIAQDMNVLPDMGTAPDAAQTADGNNPK